MHFPAELITPRTAEISNPMLVFSIRQALLAEQPRIQTRRQDTYDTPIREYWLSENGDVYANRNSWSTFTTSFDI